MNNAGLTSRWHKFDNNCGLRTHPARLTAAATGVAAIYCGACTAVYRSPLHCTIHWHTSDMSKRVPDFNWFSWIELRSRACGCDDGTFGASAVTPNTGIELALMVMMIILLPLRMMLMMMALLMAWMLCEWMLNDDTHPSRMSAAYTPPGHSIRMFFVHRHKQTIKWN